MNAISLSARPGLDRPQPVPGVASGQWGQAVALIVVAVVLVRWASAPTALVVGILCALLIGHPFAHWNQRITKWLLQVCVVVLGFGMNLPVVLRLGLNGALFAAATIGATLIVGRWLGARFGLGPKTGMLISAGTAICGGSAIAAVSAVISASEVEIAVSMGTVFLLNAVALYAFPFVGHLLQLSQGQFGLWSGVAIHDISSVVSAGLSYGPDALQTAVAVKLSRTLWIIPLTLGLSLGFGTQSPARVNATDAPRTRKFQAAIPWFIGLFLLASLLRSYVPAIAELAPAFSNLARHGMSLVLFLIGTSLSLRSLRVVGWRTVVTGSALWMFISVVSLVAIRVLNLSA